MAKQRKGDSFHVQHMRKSQPVADIWSFFPRRSFVSIWYSLKALVRIYIILSIATGSYTVAFYSPSAESGAWIRARKDKPQCLQLPKITASPKRGFICRLGCSFFFSAGRNGGKKKKTSSARMHMFFFFLFFIVRQLWEPIWRDACLVPRWKRQQQTRKLTIMLFHGAPLLEITRACSHGGEKRSGSSSTQGHSAWAPLY